MRPLPNRRFRPRPGLPELAGLLALASLATTVVAGLLDAFGPPPPEAPLVEPVPMRLVEQLGGARRPAPPPPAVSRSVGPAVAAEAARRVQLRLDEIVIHVRKPGELVGIGTRGDAHGDGTVPSLDLPGDPPRASLRDGLVLAEAVGPDVPDAIRRHRATSPDQRPAVLWRSAEDDPRGVVVLWEPSAARLARGAAVPEVVASGPPVAVGPLGARAVATRDHAAAPVPLVADARHYSGVRRLLKEGRLPDPTGVRPEAFAQAMPDDTPAPRSDKPLSVGVEVTPDPLDPELHLLRVAVRAADAPAVDAGGRRVVLLVDTSGSMALEGRLGLATAGAQALVAQLAPDDLVAVVANAGAPRLALPPTPAKKADRIVAAVAALSADGETALTAGLEAALDVALGGDARSRAVVVLSDGDANDGEEAAVRRARLARRARDLGVSVHGVSLAAGPWPGDPLAALATVGGGRHVRVLAAHEAREALPRLVVDASPVVASDVELALEFDPERVRSWRRVGWADGDTALSPARLKAGQRAVAVYEVRLRGGRRGRLGRVRVTARRPGEALDRWDVPIPARAVARSFDDASASSRLAWAAARLGERLQGAGGPDLGALGEVLARQGDLGRPGEELAELASRARFLSRRRRAGPEGVVGAGDVVRRYAGQVQYCYARSLAHRPDAAGELTVMLRVHAGQVVLAHVERDTTDDPTLQACVVRKLSRWRFPAGVDADVVLPFTLRPPPRGASSSPRAPGPDLSDGAPQR